MERDIALNDDLNGKKVRDLIDDNIFIIKHKQILHLLNLQTSLPKLMLMVLAQPMCKLC